MRVLGVLCVFALVGLVWWWLITGAPEKPVGAEAPMVVASGEGASVASRVEKPVVLEWNVQRDKVYEALKLSPEENAEVLRLRENYLRSVDDLQAQLSRAAEQDKTEISNELEDLGDNYDVAMEKLLGKERFLRLLVSLDDFNEQHGDGVEHGW